jgi:beta-galactosidase/beta-glucuronidase
MVYDLQVLKNVSMNMVRKHIKVEPDLWYRACDEMGLLVIQDMPSLQTEVAENKPSAARQSLFYPTLESG